MNTNQDAQLEALGDATRRAILARLINGPLPVGELAREFPVSRPAISQHLRVLKQARLVVDRPAGNRRLYQVNPEGIDSLRQYFEQFWTQALGAFKAAAEASDHEETR
ncbi:MAG: winged helix-turn-helix transcriptional regulator [Acidobacteriota bacterium]|nr:winged helix-turn-helix transcriptional regulator [Acidobacteriota bacterium]